MSNTEYEKGCLHHEPATCKDLLQLAEPEAVWLKRMTRQLAGDGATEILIRNHLRTIIDILRMVAPSAVKDSLTVQQPEACALCGTATANLILVCDDADDCVRRTIAAAKETK